MRFCDAEFRVFINVLIVVMLYAALLKFIMQNVAILNVALQFECN